MMNLQNIIIDFNSDTVTTMYENKHYTLGTVLTDIINVKTQFTTAYNIDNDFIVVQLSEDQHLCVPRIVCNELPPIDIQAIETEHPALAVALQTMRDAIESELQQILNN